MRKILQRLEEDMGLDQKDRNVVVASIAAPYERHRDALLRTLEALDTDMVEEAFGALQPSGDARRDGMRREQAHELVWTTAWRRLATEPITGGACNMLAQMLRERQEKK